MTIVQCHSVRRFRNFTRRAFPAPFAGGSALPHLLEAVINASTLAFWTELCRPTADAEAHYDVTNAAELVRAAVRASCRTAEECEQLLQ